MAWDRNPGLSASASDSYGFITGCSRFPLEFQRLRFDASPSDAAAPTVPRAQPVHELAADLLPVAFLGIGPVNIKGNASAIEKRAIRTRGRGSSIHVAARSLLRIVSCRRRRPASE